MARRWHRKNSVFNLRRGGGERHDFEDDGRAEVHACRSRLAYLPASRPAPPRHSGVRVLWDGLFNARSSLGILSSELTAALTTRHAVYALPWPESEGALPPGVTRHSGETVDVAVRVCDPHSATLGLWRERAGRAKRSLPFLYFDEVRLDAALARALGERCPDLLVFSRFTSAMLLAAGVRSRIEVVPLGVKLPDDISPRCEREPGPCAFVAAGYLDARKGIAPLVRAFAAEFGGDARARLTLKSVGNHPYAFADVPNVVYDGRLLDRREWFALLGQHDYFVAPTRMESFGMIGLEAAAVGTAIVYPMLSAYAAYANNVPSSVALVRGAWSDAAPAGWAVDEDELRGALRHLVDSDAYGYDRKAVAAAAARHTWARSAEIFEDVVTRILA